jgi:4-hydroxy-4-methyl-2-oxoglutarate aldolase
MTATAPIPAHDERAEAIRLRYLRVDTSNVADVLDDMGLLDQGLAPAFAPYPDDAGKLAGWAFTIRGQMAPSPVSDKDKAKMAALSQATPGSVTVWSGGGKGVCFFGELIALGMQERGCAGALVDGGVRDVAWIGSHGFPVFARYRTPVQSIGRWKVTASQVPVSLPGATARFVTVTPGDFVLADADGAIVIPARVAEAVLEQAEQLGQSEIEIRRALAGGMSLSQALERFGHV